MSIDLHIQLNGPIKWAELVSGTQAAMVELLCLQDLPELTLREWMKGRLFTVESEWLMCFAPMSIFMLSFESDLRMRCCAELHLFDITDDTVSREPRLPNRAVVSTTDKYPANVVIAAGAALVLARLCDAPLEVRGSGSIEDTRLWSAGEFARTLALQTPPRSGESAFSQLAERLRSLPLRLQTL